MWLLQETAIAVSILYVLIVDNRWKLSIILINKIRGGYNQGIKHYL